MSSRAQLQLAGAGLLLISTLVRPEWVYANTGGTTTLRGVFAAIDASPSNQAAHQLYERLATFSADNEADLIKAYGLAKKQQAASGEEVERARQRMAYAVSIITKATAPHQQEWVARLLSREAATLPSNAPGLWGAESRQDKLEQALQFGPASALIEAALMGKNRNALPALRLVFEKGGMIGKHADLAINTIGDPEDLERAVAHIKKDPEDPISLFGFGDLVVPRLIKEIEDPNLSEELRIAFIARLGATARPGNCAPYLDLLKHKHPKVREIATQNLGACLTKRDEVLILRLLLDTDRDVQWEALSAIDKKVWHPKHIPSLIAVLESASDEQNRAKAARILGKRGASEAVPALRRGLQSKSSEINRACRLALKNLGID